MDNVFRELLHPIRHKGFNEFIKGKVLTLSGPGFEKLAQTRGGWILPPS